MERIAAFCGFFVILQFQWIDLPEHFRTTTKALQSSVCLLRICHVPIVIMPYTMRAIFKTLLNTLRCFLPLRHLSVSFFAAVFMNSSALAVLVRAILDTPPDHPAGHALRDRRSRFRLRQALIVAYLRYFFSGRCCDRATIDRVR